MSIVVSVFKLLPLLFTPCLTHGIPCALKLLWSIIVLSVCHNGCVQSRAARWNHSTVSSHNSAGESSHPQLEPEGEGNRDCPCPSASGTEESSFPCYKKKLVQGFALPFAAVCEVPVEVPLVFQPLIPVWWHQQTWWGYPATSPN